MPSVLVHEDPDLSNHARSSPAAPLAQILPSNCTDLCTDLCPATAPATSPVPPRPAPRPAGLPAESTPRPSPSGGFPLPPYVFSSGSAPSVPSGPPPAPIAGLFYDLNDKRVFWLNGRPFWLHREVGKGGFGHVFQAEMLIPPGTELVRTIDGWLKMCESGFAELRVAPEVVSEARREPSEPSEWDEEPVPSMKSTFPEVASTGPPPDKMSFVLGTGWGTDEVGTGVGTEEVLQTGPRLTSSPAPAPKNGAANNTSTVRVTGAELIRQIGADQDGMFPIDSTMMVRGSGAFFALKIQTATNRNQLLYFAREAESLRKLKGCPFTVQIMDHAMSEQYLRLVILMELGACDLHSFLQSTKLQVPEVCQIWRSLVRAVDAAHGQGIIHRDVKPHNFVLVPVTPGGDRVLATTAIPKENFVLEVVNEDRELRLPSAGSGADVKLTLQDPSDPSIKQTLLLRVKLTDFGLAHPLDDLENGGASHLSVKGCCGTILYMAPETFRPAKLDGTCSTVKRVSKQVDVWALGVILFQMLHDNRTPFGVYHRADGPIGVAVAASNRDIHKEVMVFERDRVWTAEREKRLLQRASGGSAQSSCGEGGGSSRGRAEEEEQQLRATAAALLGAWTRTEFLFRMCELCLTFDSSDRAAAEDLGRWIDTAFAEDWWTIPIAEAVAEAQEVLRAGGSPAFSVDDIVGSHASTAGRVVAQAKLPEVFGTEMPDHMDQYLSDPAETTKARHTSIVSGAQTPAEVDLERADQFFYHAARITPIKVSLWWKVFAVVCLVVAVAGGAFVGAVVFGDGVWGSGNGSGGEQSVPNEQDGPGEGGSGGDHPASPTVDGGDEDCSPLATAPVAAAPSFLEPSPPQRGELVSPPPTLAPTGAPSSSSSHEPGVAPLRTAAPAASHVPYDPWASRSLDREEEHVVSAPILKDVVSAPVPVQRAAKPEAHVLPKPVFFEKRIIDQAAAIKMVEKDGMALKVLASTFGEDKRVVLAAVKNSCRAFQFIPPGALMADSDVLDAALPVGTLDLSCMDLVLSKVPPAMKHDKEFMRRVITRTKSGHALRHADPELQNDPDFVLWAVMQDDRALQYSALKEDDNFVLKAMQYHDGEALFYASGTLKGNPDFMREAEKVNKGAAQKYAMPWTRRGDGTIGSEEDVDIWFQDWEKLPLLEGKGST